VGFDFGDVDLDWLSHPRPWVSILVRAAKEILIRSVMDKPHDLKSMIGCLRFVYNKICFIFHSVLLFYPSNSFLARYQMTSPITPKIVFDDDSTTPRKSIETMIRTLNAMIRLAGLQNRGQDIKEDLMREWDPSAGST
jgi:hypothetical protein